MTCKDLNNVIASSNKITVFGLNYWGCLVALEAKNREKECCFCDFNERLPEKSLVYGIERISPDEIDLDSLFIISYGDENASFSAMSLLIGKGASRMFILEAELMEEFGRTMSDELFIKAQFYFVFGRELDLDRPSTYTEKLQWIKLYDRKPEYTMMADKLLVKDYVEKTIGDEYIIPTLGVWDSAEEITFDDLPDRFVLKCNHDSGGSVICKDKSSLDIRKTIEFLKEHLNRNFYWRGREWVYKDIKPKIIAEKYMEDADSGQLRDYKFFCFDGIPRFVQVDFDRFKNHKRNLFDMEWNLMDFELQFPRDPKTKIECPKDMDLMKEIAQKLSAGIPHVRVDLYYVEGHIYFGELTFYHGSGFEHFKPPEYDELFGSYITVV